MDRINDRDRVLGFLRSTAGRWTIDQIHANLGIPKASIMLAANALYDDRMVRRESVPNGRNQRYAYSADGVVPREHRQLMSFWDLPGWVRDMVRDEPEGDDPDDYVWIVTDNKKFEAYKLAESASSIITRREPKIPSDVNRDDVVNWYSLPVWIKGSYSNDSELRTLKSWTWVRVDADTYRAYTPEGELIQTFGRE